MITTLVDGGVSCSNDWLCFCQSTTLIHDIRYGVRAFARSSPWSAVPWHRFGMSGNSNYQSGAKAPHSKETPT